MKSKTMHGHDDGLYTVCGINRYDDGELKYNIESVDLNFSGNATKVNCKKCMKIMFR